MRALGVPHGDQDLAEAGARQPAVRASRYSPLSSAAEITSKLAPGWYRDDKRGAQDFLEVRQPVVAAESHVVAEEGEQQGVGEGLGDD